MVRSSDDQIQYLSKWIHIYHRHYGTVRLSIDTLYTNTAPTVTCNQRCRDQQAVGKNKPSGEGDGTLTMSKPTINQTLWALRQVLCLSVCLSVYLCVCVCVCHSLSLSLSLPHIQYVSLSLSHIHYVSLSISYGPHSLIFHTGISRTGISQGLTQAATLPHPTGEQMGVRRAPG